MTPQILFGIAVVPAIIGLVQVCKDLGLPVRVSPAAAILFGILAGLAQVYGSSWPWVQAVAMGVGLGLAASGLYSGTKTVVTTSGLVHLTETASPVGDSSRAVPPSSPTKD